MTPTPREQPPILDSVAAPQHGAPGVPTHVTVEEYEAVYAAQGYEWVQGALIPLSPVTEEHDELTSYLRLLLEAYLEHRPIAVVRAAPFVIRMTDMSIRREPDLMVVLNEHRGRLTKTALNGPADIVVEIVSPESVGRDYGDKNAEYEQIGVREYWIVDPHRREALFYRQANAEGEPYRFQLSMVGAGGVYRTPLLPGLDLHAPTLWQPPLPGPSRVVAAIAAMLGESNDPS